MIITAKFIALAAVTLAISLWIYALGLVVGYLVDIPGYSNELLMSASVDVLGAAVLTILLLPFVAFFSSFGRGETLAFGWAVFTVVIAQVAAITGWGDWMPWSVPALFSGAAGPRAEMLGTHSYIVVLIASGIGLFVTFWWWQFADQSK